MPPSLRPRFPSGLRIGDQGGPDGPGDGFTALWTTSLAIESYLPAGGTAGALDADSTNETTTSAGVLGGQLVAAKLNVAIAGTPSDWLFLDGCVDDELVGLSVAEVLELADQAVATGTLPADVDFSDLSDALDVLNNNFDDCTQDLGCLAPPTP